MLHKTTSCNLTLIFLRVNIKRDQQYQNFEMIIRNWQKKLLRCFHEGHKNIAMVIMVVVAMVMMVAADEGMTCWLCQGYVQLHTLKPKLVKLTKKSIPIMGSQHTRTLHRPQKSRQISTSPYGSVS